VFLCSLPFMSDAYSFEERLPLYKLGVPSSTFGYSVAQHKSDESDASSGLFAIGAPTAAALGSQGNTENPGGIFSCPFSTLDNDCERVIVDEGGSTLVNNKTGEWLGVALKSKGPGKILIACAHRTHGEQNSGSVKEKAQMCGRCFVLDGTRKDLHEIEDHPLKKNMCEMRGANAKMFWARKGFAYAQSGMSLNVDGDGENGYTVGGPGAYEWKGAVLNIVKEDEDVFGSSVNSYKTSIGTIMTPDSYNGFSLARSKNIYDDADDVIISGAPRFNFTGGVVFYKRETQKKFKRGKTYVDYQLSRLTMLHGLQVGSSYGYSLLVVDINNDGLDDLLVSAPQFYAYSTSGKNGGAVYVYVRQNGTEITAVEPQVLLGGLDSFFGQTMESLGDFDQDGFNDVAISAPQDGDSGKVFIYRGNAEGMLKLSQTIDGAKHGDVKQFGISLSGNMDMDGNKYPDLLIGTKSDVVLHLRTRPIITLTSEFTIPTKLLDLQAASRDGGCVNEKGDVCFMMKLCFKYESRHKEYEEKLPIKYSISLDSLFTGDARVVTTGKHEDHAHNSKMVSMLTKETTLRKAGEMFCEPDLKLFFLKTASDRLSPVQIELDYKLVSDEAELKPETPGSELFSMIKDPILDADYKSVHKRDVMLRHRCGADDTCQSDVHVNGTIPEEVTIGKDKYIAINLLVTNHEEEAHQSVVTIKPPPENSFVYYSRFNASNDYRNGSAGSVSCKKSQTSEEVTCSMGNPYEGGRQETIVLWYDVSNVEENVKELSFVVQHTTTSKNPVRVPLVLTSKVIVEISIDVTSTSFPKQLRYYNNPILGESAITTVEQIGPSLSYMFNVRNSGSRTARGLSLNVAYPVELYNGKWLLYLLSTSVIRAGTSELRVGKCDATYTNYLKKAIGKDSSNAIKLAQTGGRNKRQITGGNGKPPLTTKSSSSSGGKQTKLICERGSACVDIVCTLDDIKPKTTVTVVFESHLWNATFLEEFHEDRKGGKKVSELVTFITEAKLESNIGNVRLVGDTETEIETEVDHAALRVNDVTQFPWWYILIAIILSLLIYIVIIVCLFKCGFFKRKKFPDRHSPLDEDDDDVIEVTGDKERLDPHTSV